MWEDHEEGCVKAIAKMRIRFIKTSMAFLMASSWLICPGDAFAEEIKGNLDMCFVERGQYCYAWACAPDHPERLVALRLSFPDKTLISSAVLANAAREEAVGQACGGNNNRGAFFDLDEAALNLFSDGNSHEVTLEALDPDGRNYVPLATKWIQAKEPLASQTILFQQEPYTGIVIDLPTAKDIDSLPKGVFGSANFYGTTAVVEFAKMTRIFLDSTGFKPNDPSATLFTSCPFYIFPQEINPWPLGRKLSVSVSLAVHSAKRWNGGEVYIPLYTLWSDGAGHRFWFGWQLFDLRASRERALELDDCGLCTGLPIVAGYADGGIYGHPAVDSARFMNFPGESGGPARFTIQLTWENFRNAVAAAHKVLANRGYPDDPSRYKLESIWLNPEIYTGSSGGGGLLDIQFFGLSIGVQ